MMIPERLVHAVALHGGMDAERARVGWQCAGPDAEHGAAARQVVELDNPLRDIEWVVVWKRHDAGAKHDPGRAFARRRKEHFRRTDRFPPARMVFAAPKFVVAEGVEVRGEFEVAPDLEGRVFANRVMRREESAKAETAHEVLRSGLRFRPFCHTGQQFAPSPRALSRTGYL